MPIGEFGIERYYVAQGRLVEGPAPGLPAGPVSVIDVFGELGASGSQDAAQLLFAPAFDAGLSRDVDNVGLPADGLRVWANLPYEDFTRIYDILRNEAPVRLWCEYEEGTTATRPLTFVGISTLSGEKPGEGPADPSSANQFIRMAPGGVAGFERHTRQAGPRS